MEPSTVAYAAFFAVAMYVAAVNAKALGVTIALCLGLVAVYPSLDQGGFLFVLYIPAVLLSNFRD